MELSFEIWLFIVIGVAIVGFFGFRMIRYGGYKGAVFGARIERTIGEVGAQGVLHGMTVKVHVLRPDPSRTFIGIEYSRKDAVGHDMSVIKLSVSEAEQLASLLQNAVRAHEAT